MNLELDQFRNVDLVIDRANDSFVQKQFVSQGDYKGRMLTVQVTNNGNIGEVTGLTLNLHWHNEASGITDLSAFTVINKSTSVFGIEYPQHMMTPGKVYASIQVIQNGKVTNLKEFELTVQKLAGQPVGIVGKAEFSALVAVLADSNKFRTDIDSLDTTKADKTALSQTNTLLSNGLNSKVDKGGNEQISMRMLTTEVKTAMTGGSVAVVGVDAVGTENVKDSAITQSKIDEIGEDSLNILNLDTMLTGKAITSVDGKATLIDSANWSVNPTAYPVKHGDLVRFNKAFSENHYYGVDGNGKVLQVGKASTDGNQTITVAIGVVGFYSNVLNTNKSTAMITINTQMPASYTPFGTERKRLLWLSVAESNLDESLKKKINSAANVSDQLISDWEGKTMIAAGDSITWQDGRVYSGTSNIARGWQTIVKENLGLASVNNIAVSGKPMADGTSNGDGTVTTVLLETVFTEDLFVIAAGTNDFKLNVPIGELQNVGGTFDRNTFYGAYQTTLEYIINKRPDIRIVLFTPLHRNESNYNSTIFTNTAGHKLIDYVEAIKALGDRYSIPVCDMYANSGINMLTLGVDTRDGLHPNDVGYAKMGRYASKFIDNL